MILRAFQPKIYRLNTVFGRNRMKPMSPFYIKVEKTQLIFILPFLSFQKECIV